MKVGDIVRLDPERYIVEKDYVGQIIERAPVGTLLAAGYSGYFSGGPRWIVLIKDRIHPYYIAENDMAVINESR